eukprot:3024031-Pyramimonas_sp.AAC.1
MGWIEERLIPEQARNMSRNLRGIAGRNEDLQVIVHGKPYPECTTRLPWQLKRSQSHEPMSQEEAFGFVSKGSLGSPSRAEFQIRAHISSLGIAVDGWASGNAGVQVRVYLLSSCHVIPVMAGIWQVRNGKGSCDFQETE